MQTVKAMDLKYEAIRAELAAIAAANNGYLDAVKVVQAARDPLSLLHDEFTWDDEDAAEHYRIAQAGALIRRVKFTIMKQDRETKAVELTTTRVYQSRISSRQGGEQKGYETIQDIMAVPAKREELINQVIRELNAYRKRYADLMALSAIWQAIDYAVELHSDAPTRLGAAAQADTRAM